MDRTQQQLPDNRHKAAVWEFQSMQSHTIFRVSTRWDLEKLMRSPFWRATDRVRLRWAIMMAGCLVEPTVEVHMVKNVITKLCA